MKKTIQNEELLPSKGLKQQVAKTVVVLLSFFCLFKASADEIGPSTCGKPIIVRGDIQHYTSKNGSTVANATHQNMYLEEVYGNDFTALIQDLSEGTYTLEIYIAEQYHTKAGARLFNIYVDDKLIKENLDVFSEVGVNSELKISYPITFSTGKNNNEINIRFKAITENCIFNAIHVLDKNKKPVACVMASELSRYIELGKGNPIITQRFCADPDALVHEGRVYVYCSSDEDNVDSYDGLLNYTLISSDDMVNWTDHGLVFKVKEDSKWADNAYAPSVVFRNGKFYLYYPNAGNSIGVAVSDKPEGPFVDPLGKPLIDKSMPNCDVSWLFDPCAYIDDDGQAYLYFGGGKNENSPYGRNFRVIKLNEDMISVDGTAITIDSPHSFEGPFVHKKDSRYYLSYPGLPGQHIYYITADNPLFTNSEFQGVVLPSPSLDGENINLRNNSHESIILFNDQWYMFYHDRRISNKDYKRNVCVDLLAYNEDGTMKKVVVTRESVPQIKSLNPFEKVESETMDCQNGIEVEPCSEGGCMITEISDGDWTSVSGVDFGSGAKKVQIRVAAEGKGGTIEIRLGSETGKLIGTCKIKGTGSWDKWKTIPCSVSEVSGVNDLYLVYRGADEPFRLNWYQFKAQ